MSANAKPPNTVFLFDGFRLDRRGLVRKHGDAQWTPIPLGSRAIGLLAALVERSGEIVTKQTLMETVWPDVSVEDSNLAVQMAALRRVLDEGRGGESCIQTFIGRGYRFLPAVAAETDGPAEPSGLAPEIANTSASSAPSETQLPRAVSVAVLCARAGSQKTALITLLVLAILALGAVVSWQRGNRQQTAALSAPRLSIVVLPFQNLSDDSSDDYLANAITSDLTTDLSHVPQTFVIAHASARAISARNVDARQIGRELGVRYVVEGSVQRLGSVLRVNAELISSETGGHLWADRYDQDIADLGSGQEQVLARMRGALGMNLVDIEAERSQRERPSRPDAFDLILRARWWSNQPPSPQRMQQAQDLYRRALMLDPGSIAAMTGLANTFSEENMNWAGQWLSSENQHLAETLVGPALTLAPSSEAALVAQARLLHGQSQFAALLSPAQRLVELFPNNPEGYHHLARVRQFEGRFADAVTMFEKAILLDPLDPRIFQRYGLMAFSMMQAGRYDNSAAWFARSLAADPDAPPSLRATRYRNMSASLALAGRLEEAHRAAEEAQRLWPFDTVRSHYPLALDSKALVAHELIFRRGLALAGVRDHAEEDADFGAPPTSVLHTDLGGGTPITAPGATTIRTGELARMLESDVRPIVLETVTHFWGRSIPGAIGLTSVGMGGTLTDGTQERLLRTMVKMLGDDRNRPIVAVGWNSECFDGYNLALRLVALGYTNIRWYRGGREAWEVKGLPETDLSPQD